MNTDIGFLLFIIALVAVSVTIAIQRNKNLQRFLARRCAGVEWKRQFPDASPNDIRRFLDIFVDAFLFRSRLRLKFSPNDRIKDIYRAVYFDPCMADTLELQTLAELIRQEYKIDIVPFWNQNCTLGNIFELTRNRNGSPNGVTTG